MAFLESKYPQQFGLFLKTKTPANAERSGFQTRCGALHSAEVRTSNFVLANISFQSSRLFLMFNIENNVNWVKAMLVNARSYTFW